MSNADFSLPLVPPVRRPSRLRSVLTLACAGLLLFVVAAVFWFQDGRYSLPTPKPVTLVAVGTGTPVVLPASLRLAAEDPRPLFLHFFNPDCPCSRFNADHVRALRQRFGAQARFVAVVQIIGDQDAAQRQESLAVVTRLFGPGLDAVIDDGGRIAAACGVYSTPQAVILAAGPAHALLFRGNYNASRYCADPETQFARLALTAVVNHEALPPASRAAMVAYGCELPANVAAKSALARAEL